MYDFPYDVLDQLRMCASATYSDYYLAVTAAIMYVVDALCGNAYSIAGAL